MLIRILKLNISMWHFLFHQEHLQSVVGSTLYHAQVIDYSTPPLLSVCTHRPYSISTPFYLFTHALIGLHMHSELLNPTLWLLQLPWYLLHHFFKKGFKHQLIVSPMALVHTQSNTFKCIHLLSSNLHCPQVTAPPHIKLLLPIYQCDILYHLQFLRYFLHKQIIILLCYSLCTHIQFLLYISGHTITIFQSSEPIYDSLINVWHLTTQWSYTVKEIEGTILIQT